MVPLDEPADVLAVLCSVQDGEVLAVIHLVLSSYVTGLLTRVRSLSLILTSAGLAVYADFDADNLVSIFTGFSEREFFTATR